MKNGKRILNENAYAVEVRDEGAMESQTIILYLELGERVCIQRVGGSDPFWEPWIWD